MAAGAPDGVKGERCMKLEGAFSECIKADRVYVPHLNTIRLVCSRRLPRLANGARVIGTGQSRPEMGSAPEPERLDGSETDYQISHRHSAAYLIKGAAPSVMSFVRGHLPQPHLLSSYTSVQTASPPVSLPTRPFPLKSHPGLPLSPRPPCPVPHLPPTDAIAIPLHTTSTSAEPIQRKIPLPRTRS